ncbi:MAG: YifB family Mg chelatase-like AAA ATPase, partial [Chromatiaceae bacterium]
AVRDAGRALLLPKENAAEAALVSDLTVYPAGHLLEVCEHLNGTALLRPFERNEESQCTPAYPDLADVRGQEHAKRALEIAAAGGHSLLFIGPPGTGKSMLASRLAGILPPMTEADALEAAAVRSVSGLEPFDPGRWRERPFRSPHHTASGVALVGGGSNPRPGEISLAHLGVLFLDELPEFDRRVLEVLREPLESGHIHISRAARQAKFPAQFQLIAAMNPCPCGYLGDPGGRCRCTAEQVARYRARISGPLLDRIDLHVEVPRLPPERLSGPPPSPGDTSAAVRRRVEAAREHQLARAGRPNCALIPPEIERTCALDDAGRKLLTQALAQLGLSARAYHRVLKVARTIADLAASPDITTVHLSEAIGYRRLDRSSRRH